MASKRKSKQYPSAGDVLSFAYLLKLADSPESFRLWVIENRADVDVEKAFWGYTYYLELVLNCLMNAVWEDESLGLESDIVLYRAWHRGIQIDEVPNDCEKIVLMKRISSVMRAVRRARNWHQLADQVESIEAIAGPFMTIFSRHTSARKGCSKKRELREFAVTRLRAYLQSSNPGYPVAQFVNTMARCSRDPRQVVENFDGYLIALEYAWTLLSEADDRYSAMKTLHTSLVGVQEEARSRVKYDERDWPVWTPLSPDIAPYYADSRSSSMSWAGRARVLWTALDLLSNRIPSESDSSRSRDVLESWTAPCLTIRAYDKNLLAPLLDEATAKSPEYMARSDPDSLMKQLDYHLAWYDLDALSSARSQIFSGVPAFMSTVAGFSILRRSKGNDEPVHVRIFKHPVSDVPKGSDYSYAVLLQSYGTFSDYSGWLVFYDAAGDYSGFAGSMFRDTNEFLKSMASENLVTVKEVVIGADVFKAYIECKNAAIDGESDAMRLLDASEHINKLESVIDDAKSKLLEHRVYYTLTLDKSTDFADVDASLGFSQIDCYQVTKDAVRVCECKINLHDNVDRLSDSMAKKVCSAQNVYPDKRVEPFVVVYGPVSMERAAQLESRGIRVKGDFRKELLENPAYRLSEKRAIQILDYRHRRTWVHFE